VGVRQLAGHILIAVLALDRFGFSPGNVFLKGFDRAQVLAAGLGRIAQRLSLCSVFCQQLVAFIE
jgi:hypothetical protein